MSTEKSPRKPEVYILTPEQLSSILGSMSAKKNLSTPQLDQFFSKEKIEKNERLKKPSSNHPHDSITFKELFGDALGFKISHEAPNSKEDQAKKDGSDFISDMINTIGGVIFSQEPFSSPKQEQSTTTDPVATATEDFTIPVEKTPSPVEAKIPWVNEEKQKNLLGEELLIAEENEEKLMIFIPLYGKSEITLSVKEQCLEFLVETKVKVVSQKFEIPENISRTSLIQYPITNVEKYDLKNLISEKTENHFCIQFPIKKSEEFSAKRVF